jgi:aspartate aminotransferase
MEDINGRSSWIRRMFEVGNQMRAQIGADKVFDFTIGNPTAEPPAGFLAALRHCADDTVTTGTHRYMSNQGFQGTRRAVAAMVASVEEGMAPSEDHIVMTCGAAGAISSFFKAVLDEGDEVIVLLPFCKIFIERLHFFLPDVIII